MVEDVLRYFFFQQQPAQRTELPLHTKNLLIKLAAHKLSQKYAYCNIISPRSEESD